MDQFPENTLAALSGVASSVDAVEIDVRRCGSGELVVFHDERLGRVTDGTGPVGETPLSRLRELDVLGTGERIPILSEAFGTLPDEVTLNVELKERGIAESVRGVSAGYDNDVLVSSFDPGALREALDAGFDDLGLLCWDDGYDPIDTAVSLNCEYVHPHLDLCSGGDFVERAHDRGLGVNAWTARTEADVSVLRKAGADGVICDRLDIV